MDSVRCGDFSVFPASICRGLKPEEQVLVAWLWVHRMSSMSNIMPPMRRLAEECGMSLRSVNSYIQVLREKGLIEAEQIPSETGVQNLHYNVRFPVGEERAFIVKHKPKNNNDSTEDTKGVVQDLHKFSPVKYASIWTETRGGIFPYKEASRNLKSLEVMYGQEKLVAAFDCFCKNTKLSIWTFIQSPLQWLNGNAPVEKKIDESKRW